MRGLKGRTPLPLLLAAILTSCATTGIGGTDPAIGDAAIRRVCAAWPHVSWSLRDTPATIRDAKAGNAARDGFCGDADPTRTAAGDGPPAVKSLP